MLSIPILNIGVWLFFLTCGFSVYSVSEKFVSKVGQSILGIQLVIVLLIVSKYVELYALTIFHSKEVQMQDLTYIALILGVCTFCQLACLHFRQTKTSIGLMLLTALNTGVVAYLAMVLS